MQVLNYSLQKLCPSAIMLAMSALFWMVPSTSVTAQQEPAKEELEETAEEPGKMTSRLGLTTTQMPGDTVELQALLRAKIEGSWQTVSSEKVKFFFTGGEAEKSLGEATTGASGIAYIKIAAGDWPINEEGFLSFVVRFEGNEKLDESEADANIQKATMTLTPVKGDSTNSISLNIVAGSTDATPMAEVNVMLFVKRMVGRLKVGEGTTDEEGNVDIELPADLPGDANGELFIIALIEDLEGYGNVMATTLQPWGKSVSYEVKDLPKALWSPHPPSWMVVTFFVLMATVWGHYAVIVYKLSQVRQAG